VSTTSTQDFHFDFAVVRLLAPPRTQLFPARTTSGSESREQGFPTRVKNFLSGRCYVGSIINSSCCVLCVGALCLAWWSLSFSSLCSTRSQTSFVLGWSSWFSSSICLVVSGCLQVILSCVLELPDQKMRISSFICA
jgi:hypothetical protein